MHSTRTATAAPGALGLRGFLAAAVVMLAAFAISPHPVNAAVATACSVTDGASGYSARVCVSAPASTVSGSIEIEAAVTLSARKSGVSSVAFCLDGSPDSSPPCTEGGPGYLLVDPTPQSRIPPTTTYWRFQLPTAKWADGSHTLTAVATLYDGTTSEPTSMTLSFANGKPQQPINNTSPVLVSPTAPSAGAPFVVAATGGGYGADSTAQARARLISSWSPNLFLYLGDVRARGSYTEFVNWFDPIFGVFDPITAPVPGDRDYASAADLATSPQTVPPHVAYFDHWNNLPDFYSFDAGGWHFIALDSNGSAMTGERWYKQLSWVASDLANHPGVCTVALWHAPAFTLAASSTAYSRKLWSLLAGRATVVLNGHSRTYQRWAAMDADGKPSHSGTIEVVAGTGDVTAPATSDPRIARASSAPEAVRLSLTSTAIQIDAVGVDGSKLDSATIPCLHATAPSAAQASAGGGAGAQGTGAGTETPPEPPAAPSSPALPEPPGIALSAFVVAAVALVAWRLARLDPGTLAVLMAIGVTILVGGTILSVPLYPMTNLPVLALAIAAGIAVARSISPRRVAALSSLAGAAAVAAIAPVGGVIDRSLAFGILPPSDASPGLEYRAFLWQSGTAQTGLGLLLLVFVAGLAAHAGLRRLPPWAAALPALTGIAAVAAVPPHAPTTLLVGMAAGWVAAELALAVAGRWRHGRRTPPLPTPLLAEVAAPHGAGATSDESGESRDGVVYASLLRADHGRRPRAR